MPVLIPCHSEEEQVLIKHSMEGGPFSAGIKCYSKEDVEEIADLEKALDQPDATK
jgi:hypothetical protein